MSRRRPTALVIGAGKGIGRALGEVLAEQGYAIIAADVDRAAADSLAEDVNARGGDAVSETVDLASPDSISDLFARIAAAGTSLDAAANVAGVTGTAALLADVAAADFRRVLDVNLTGTFLAMQHEIRVMLSQENGGGIVNVSSAAGLVAVRGASAYTASKHAIIGLTRAAAVEYVKDGIRINALAPSHIDTPMLRASLAAAPDPSGAEAELMSGVPAGRLGTPRDVAYAAAFLLSDHARYVAGAVLSVDGGYVAV